MTTRTPTQINDDIMTAVIGDYDDDTKRVTELSTRLINAIVWSECEPAETWAEVAKRQIESLADIPEPGPKDFPRVFGAVTDCDIQDSPRRMAREIQMRVRNRQPWNWEEVDTFILDNI